MFFDKVSIICKAGNGGDGAVSFRREKYVPNGGPDGGDGGKGGSIIFKATTNLSNLSGFRFKRNFKAPSGENGSGKNKYGKNGIDMTILVPVGTVIRNAESGKVVADFISDTDEVVLLKGGLGGRGNAKFTSSTRQAPGFSEKGIKTKEFDLVLELKTLADVGLIGFPNVGKSSLLASVTNAKPKIANYHFTTLSPNIGIVNFYDKSFVMADIPGLISGASDGIGLGLEFLKHIERTRLLIHVVDVAETEGRDAFSDYLAINNELKKYGNVVAKIPQIIALNKMDMVTDESKVEEFLSKISGETVFKISALNHTGLNALLEEVVKRLSELPPLKRTKIEEIDIDKRDVVSLNITKTSNGFSVSGGKIEYLLRAIELEDYRSNAYFQKRIKEAGVIDELKKQGLKKGDIVKLLDIELEYVED